MPVRFKTLSVVIFTSKKAEKKLLFITDLFLTDLGPTDIDKY